MICRGQGSSEGEAPHLVVGDQALLGLRHHGALLLGARHDALQGIRDLLLGDLLQVAPRRQDGCLVHQVLDVCACEACGMGTAPCEHSTGDVWIVKHLDCTSK